MTCCDECGYDWASTNDQAVTVINVLPDRLERLLQHLSVSDDDTRLRNRPADDRWSPLEYIAHTTDALAWYADRVHRALTIERPTFDRCDWDAHTHAQRYHDRPLDEVLAALGQRCGQFAADLAGLSVDDWVREGIGSGGDPRSVAALAHRAAHEAKHHLRDIVLGLTGRDHQ